MAIASAVKSGNSVKVYDTRGLIITTIPLYFGETLSGYTSDTVSIDSKNSIKIYNERGIITTTIPK